MSSGDLSISPSLTIPEGEIEETASRSSGPGGQHVNKTNTRVTLRWNVRESPVLSDAQRARVIENLGARLTLRGALVVSAEKTRSRSKNRQLAQERLAELVGDALLTPKERRATRPTRSSRERKLAEKARRGELKRHRGRVQRDED
jgi:ribosome-associated protein